MRNRHVAATALLSILIAAPAGAQLAPDLVIHNANVITLDRANSKAEAVAVHDGKIVSVGSNRAVLNLAVPRTRTIDAGGRTVIPGFYDSHIHLGRLALNLKKVQVADVDSIAMLLDRIKLRAAATPKGAWIETASDWHESQLKEGRFPTRWELDEVTPDHPVFIRRGGHNVVLNTSAMRKAGIADDAADPKGGHYHRDAQGRLDGWILERPAIMPVARLLPRPSPGEYAAAMKQAIAILNARGVTSVRDMHVNPLSVRVWQTLWARSELNIRGNLILSIHPRRPAKLDIDQWGSMGMISGFGDDMLRIGGLKMTHDGGVEASLLKQDFANKPGFRGIPVAPLKKVREISMWACKNDWRMAVHTVGDRAIENVLGVYEEIHKTCPVAGKRWALEHPYLPSAAAIEKIKWLGVIVTTQTGHNYTLGAGWMEFWGKDRANAAIPNRTYIDNGILPAGGTDAPVTPYDPFLTLWMDVTRETKAAGVLGPDQAVTPLEALKMHTIWAARVSGEENLKGSIEVGKFADLAIISANPLAIPAGQIKAIRVHTTIVDGRIVHQR